MFGPNSRFTFFIVVNFSWFWDCGGSWFVLLSGFCWFLIQDGLWILVVAGFLRCMVSGVCLFFCGFWLLVVSGSLWFLVSDGFWFSAFSFFRLVLMLLRILLPSRRLVPKMMMAPNQNKQTILVRHKLSGWLVTLCAVCCGFHYNWFLIDCNLRADSPLGVPNVRAPWPTSGKL